MGSSDRTRRRRVLPRHRTHDRRVERFAEYYKAQACSGMPQKGATIDYSQDLELDLSSIKPSVAGPKRPQDRIDLDKVSPRSRGFSARR